MLKMFNIFKAITMVFVRSYGLILLIKIFIQNIFFRVNISHVVNKTCRHYIYRLFSLFYINRLFVILCNIKKVINKKIILLSHQKEIS